MHFCQDGSCGPPAGGFCGYSTVSVVCDADSTSNASTPGIGVASATAGSKTSLPESGVGLGSWAPTLPGSDNRKPIPSAAHIATTRTLDRSVTGLLHANINSERPPARHAQDRDHAQIPLDQARYWM